MAYSAKAIANTVIEMARARGIFDVSPMKLQKLIFYAQSWSLKLNNVKLFSDPIERWDYGPVVRDVYHEFKGFGYHPITLLATDALGYIPVVRPDDLYSLDLIGRVLDVYGRFSAIELSNMTHAQGTAWKMGKTETIISDEDLKNGKV
ncbi:hypothetical protein I926_00880 [Pasteurella multocida subsp. multocida OH4807]|nr:hypothetical protein I926_00880 [Pasteurella multocida subsp. multocida OH4807]